MKALVKAYYRTRHLIPRPVRTQIRRRVMLHQRARSTDIWPIHPATAENRPERLVWPDGKKFTVVLTHDVELAGGAAKASQLAALEERLGFRSSFNFVPERYHTPPELRAELERRGFEVGVHGLLHDGRLYETQETFMERAQKINAYLADWKAEGFRSPSMHHNLDWLHALNIKYDLSTFDTDPFEPDSRPLGTIFPQWIPPQEHRPGYVELPYTLAQDSSLYLIMKERDNRIWKQKLDWLADQGGMVLLNVHPDYIDFMENKRPEPYTYPAAIYRDFLDYIRTEYAGQYWHPLPKELAEWVRPLLTEAA